MKKLREKSRYFTRGELALWLSSVLAIIISFFLFRGDSSLTLIASVVGVTSLIFCAKGNPVGQVLIIVFSIFYGVISFSFSYYGEMITYLGMTAPMAVASLVSWLKNPYDGNKSEVRVARMGELDLIWMVVLTAVVTALFYFILRAFHTANLVPSTVSVATSFLAVYLTFRRSACYALAYAANDAVLIVMWGLASVSDFSYLSVLVCFLVFMVNDLYGFINWKKMYNRQRASQP